MNQVQALLSILHRTEKSAVAMLEKEFEGVTMAPQVAAVYEQKRESVARIEAALGKTKT